MTGVRFAGVGIDAADPERLAGFWAGLLGWNTRPTTAGHVRLEPTDDTAHRIEFVPAATPKPGQNRIHFDLTSASGEAMRHTVERAIALGARRVDIGQGDAEHEVLADPEGNEFCVIEPGNQFLAGTGVIGAVNCDGTRAVGLFWARALDWPLVWDRDEETAIQSPAGGSKLTWSGPPLMPRPPRDRLRLQVAVARPTDLPAAVERLVVLGASRVPGEPVGRGVTLADPDGSLFRVLVDG